MKKLRVGVLMGGKSVEREVSFNSGRTICDHLDTTYYDIVPVFQRASGILYLLPWSFLHRGKIADFEDRLDAEAQKISWDDLKKYIDFMYIATHGRYAEDGTLQGMLETLGIPYLGSKVSAAALSMDKDFQKKILAAHGIDVPRSVTIPGSDASDSSVIERLMKAHALNLPVIVKPVYEGSSLGVTVVRKHEELLSACTAAAAVYADKKQAVIIEEYITGTEFTAVVITDNATGSRKVLPLTEIVIEPGTDLYTYEQKYMPGRASKYTPARISPEDALRIKEICIKAMHVLGITNLMRIDGFLTPDKRIVIFDPNILSGMAPSSFLFRQAAEINMSHTQLINHLIETELLAYGMLDARVYTNKKAEAMVTDSKIKVAVLLGGRSNEKEISLESGRNIVYKLSPEKYEAFPLFVDKNLELHLLDTRTLVHNSTKEIEENLSSCKKIAWSELPTMVDFVFIGLHGGEGENGTIQGTLETLGLPYNGSSVLASSLCMDKYRTNSFLASQGFAVPAHYFVQKDTWQSDKNAVADAIAHEIGFPVVIKPHDDGCSVFVSQARNHQELTQALDALFATTKTAALVEEYIVGMELTVGVIGNAHPQALPPSQAVANQGILSIEEKFLPGAGENRTPAPLPHDVLETVKRIMEQVYAAVGCSGYARIDCFYQSAEQSKTGSARVVIIEINNLPALTPATCLFHQAAEIGIKPMDFVDKLIQLGFEKHAGSL